MESFEVDQELDYEYEETTPRPNQAVAPVNDPIIKMIDAALEDSGDEMDAPSDNPVKAPDNGPPSTPAPTSLPSTSTGILAPTQVSSIPEENMDTTQGTIFLRHGPSLPELLAQDKAKVSEKPKARQPPKGGRRSSPLTLQKKPHEEVQNVDSKPAKI